MTAADKYGAIKSLSAETLQQVRTAGATQAANGVKQQAEIGNPTSAITVTAKYGSGGSPSRQPELPPPTRTR